MIYGYARISTTDQNLDRQLIQLRAQGIPDRDILCDEKSGKDFCRKSWNSLVGTSETTPLLRKGDLLVVTNLDRLGRDYSEIRHQWAVITLELGADIRVLDMPLLDTTNNGNDLDRRFIADLVLQILSYVAEKERREIKERQAEGIAAAKASGRPIGRPKAEFPPEWKDTYKKLMAGSITTGQAMDLMNLKHTTYYKLKRIYESKKPQKDIN
jgi:DNA invertase Pin-like site-specific DNA recombinase